MLLWIFLLPTFTAGPIERFDHFLANRAEKPDEAAGWVEDVVCERIPRKFGLRTTEIQVLAPMYRGPAGVNALKNIQPSLQDVREYVYGDKWDWYDSYPARPIEAVIKVDAVIPGCPIDRDEFVKVVKAVLVGKKPPVPDYPVCVECKLKENVCMFDKGGTCLGPITRAGCGAICPTYGDGCEGCRGLIPNPNVNAMEDVLAKAGLTVEQLMSKMTDC